MAETDLKMKKKQSSRKWDFISKPSIEFSKSNSLVGEQLSKVWGNEKAAQSQSSKFKPLAQSFKH